MKNIMIASGVAIVCAGALAFVFRTPIEQYIGKTSAHYIIDNPKVIEQSIINLQAHKQKEEQEKSKQMVEKYGKDLFNDKDGSPILGNKSGAIQMVVFMDPFCGYCRRFHTVLEQAAQKHSDLKIIVREIPFLSEKSEMVIRAMLAANYQGKYKQVQDAMYTTDPSVTENEVLGLAKAVDVNSQQLLSDMQRPEVKDLIKRNLQLAKDIHVTGTPTFILDGQVIPGAVSYDMLKDMIKKDTKKQEAIPNK